MLLKKQMSLRLLGALLLSLAPAYFSSLRAQLPAVGDTLRGGVVVDFGTTSGSVLILHPRQDPAPWTGANTWAATLTTAGLAWRQPTLSELQAFYNNRTVVNAGLAKFSGSVPIASSFSWSGSVDAGGSIYYTVGDASIIDPMYFTLSQRAVSSFNIFAEQLTGEKAGVVTGTNAVVGNSIVWGNTDKNSAAAEISGSGSISHSAVGAGAPAGTGNATVAAEDFVNAAANDYHLAVSTMLVYAGDAGALPSSLTEDLDGKPRAVGSIVDMGAYQLSFGVAYEFPDVPTVNNNAASNGGYTFVAFQWYREGVAIAGATRPYYQIKDNASYYCVATLDNGAVWRTIVVQNVAPHSSVRLVAYPNPTQGTLTVKSKNSVIDNAQIQVFDLKGNLVFSTHENPFDISHLPQGVYLVKVNGETVKMLKK